MDEFSRLVHYVKCTAANVSDITVINVMPWRRYRGLAKNTAQVLTLVALPNRWMARRQLMSAEG